MKKQIMLLAIVLGGVLSLQAQEKQDSPSQSKQEVSPQIRKKGTDWSKQPIGYFYGGIGVGYILSTEDVEGLPDSAMTTGLEWRLGMSRYYNRWGWGVLVQQFRIKQSFPLTDGYQTATLEDVGRLLYIAPQFTGRWVLGEKLTIYGAVGWGWLRYKETAKIGGSGDITATANTLGGNFTVGLEYRLNSVIGLSVDAGLIGGELGKMKVDDDELQAFFDEAYTGKMDASRLYATAGVHIYIWKKK